MRNIEACLFVGPNDCTTLQRLAAEGKTPQKIAARARIVLLSGRGLGTSPIQRDKLTLIGRKMVVRMSNIMPTVSPRSTSPWPRS